MEIATAVGNVPVTKHRQPYTEWQNVDQAGVARVNVAVSDDAPRGATNPADYAEDHAGQTVRTRTYSRSVTTTLTEARATRSFSSTVTSSTSTTTA